MTQNRKNRAANKLQMQLKKIDPLTKNQSRMFESNNNLVAHGAAGTGKTFSSFYIALDEVIRKDAYSHIALIRSAVPTRDIGFLPGNEKEKTEIYQNPYREICQELFDRADAYDYLCSKGVVRFMTTSFIRGSNLRDAIVIVDEYQNMTFHELDSIITRMGEGTRVIFSGDTHQSDLGPKTGIRQFNKILKVMGGFDFIEFGLEDIVRGPIVKDYIAAKYALGDENESSNKQ